MKRNLLAIFSALALLLCGVVKAQTVNTGPPVSWVKAGMNDVPAVKMPAFDLAAMQAEDAINDEYKVGPWRFGKNHEVNLNLNNSGVWETLNSGDRVWRLALRSEGAMTINVIFDEFYVPEGATIHMYDKDRTNLLGAYTSINNNDARVLGTELVHGDHIIVEYFEPAYVAGQGSLTIGTVTHGYRSLAKRAQYLLKGLNDAGDCNIDVGCPLGNNWSDQIRSVAMIVVNGNGSCTGALVNNTANDGTPYFLTANHCGTNAANWAFRFNWDSPVADCATTAPSQDPGPPYDETANGATLRATNAGSDFGLFEITSTIPSNWDVYFAGWDNSDNATTSQVGIHHPSGDVKKICEDTDPATQTQWNGAECWEITAWNEGTTEPGSSGSPLFDQNGRVIGQLYGGSAACSGVVDNDQPDYYGRFGISWDGASSAERLRDWLDPNNSGITVLDGYDPNAAQFANDARVMAIANIDAFICGSGSITPDVTIRNNGTDPLTSVNINYQLDGGTVNTQPWTGNLASLGTDVVTLPTMGITDGSHTFTVFTSDPNGVADQDPGNDSQTTNFDAMVVGQEITLNLTMANTGAETSWEVVDVNNTVLYSGGPYNSLGDGETATETFCLSDGCYDFIIYDSANDGLSAANSGQDGDFVVTDANNNVLTQLGTPVDFGGQGTYNFCVNNTSVPELDNFDELNVYPNPSTGQITIDFTGFEGSDVTVSVYNALGETVRTGFLAHPAGRRLHYDLSAYRNGLYLIEFRTAERRIVRRITLNK